MSKTPARASPQTIIPAQAAVFVIPAQAGIQFYLLLSPIHSLAEGAWIPACAGMTERFDSKSQILKSRKSKSVA